MSDELMAIYLCLNYIKDNTQTNAVSLVDSLSSLEALNSPLYKINNPLVY